MKVGEPLPEAVVFLNSVGVERWVNAGCLARLPPASAWRVRRRPSSFDGRSSLNNQHSPVSFLRSCNWWRKHTNTACFLKERQGKSSTSREEALSGEIEAVGGFIILCAGVGSVLGCSPTRPQNVQAPEKPSGPRGASAACSRPAEISFGSTLLLTPCRGCSQAASKRVCLA